MRKDTDMTLKLVMSAGVFAFADLSFEKRLEYISRAQMGEFKDQPAVKYVLLTKEEQQSVNEFRKSHGPDHDAGVVESSTDEIEAIEDRQEHRNRAQ